MAHRETPTEEPLLFSRGRKGSYVDKPPKAWALALLHSGQSLSLAWTSTSPLVRECSHQSLQGKTPVGEAHGWRWSGLPVGSTSSALPGAVGSGLGSGMGLGVSGPRAGLWFLLASFLPAPQPSPLKSTGNSLFGSPGSAGRTTRGDVLKAFGE